jgi:hypothetical protein
MSNHMFYLLIEKEEKKDDPYDEHGSNVAINR